jgi:hypothetical protein
MNKYTFNVQKDALHYGQQTTIIYIQRLNPKPKSTKVGYREAHLQSYYFFKHNFQIYLRFFFYGMVN